MFSKKKIYDLICFENVTGSIHNGALEHHYLVRLHLLHKTCWVDQNLEVQTGHDESMHYKKDMSRLDMTSQCIIKKI